MRFKRNISLQYESLFFKTFKLGRQNQRGNARLGREWNKLSLYCGKNSKPYFVYIDTEKQGVRSGGSISTIVMIFQHPNILPQMIPSATKWWNYILRWPLLGSEITPTLHATEHFRYWKLFVGITVAWDDLGMEGIASFPLQQWDGMVAHLSSAGVLQHSLLY